MSQRTPEPRPRRAAKTAGRRQSDGVPREAWDLLMDRLDSQDAVLVEVRDELREVKVQTQKTNGRVTALEFDKKQREDTAAADDQRRVRRTDQLRWRYGTGLAAASTLLGGILAEAFHIHL